ncbi:hypothetical protein TVAG_486810 [Trichomonas vaginalis G3]|uniref:Uncharacterized protein n=1 Tax=Trichomonas vaginalis (strain ATCC PRA-98 / G3) TaxID=412133 RepID=A2DZA9_TRIV3|nr:spectrin binding [Trichomonas vaginalis G3]EAY14238.1 hypothetical protein TVAG_486810 [Trichomonas vaginalis G3]KAI5491904.1 spectrin binding [Trichomonas vaginalis G3]|eukprot:XP_001326461.1 hypothetical protein [Trichomonas vaginalis G3]
MSAEKYIQRAERHVAAQKDTADDVASLAKVVGECIAFPSFFKLPLELILAAFEASKVQLTEQQITKAEESIKSVHGHRAAKKFKSLKRITKLLASIAEDKASLQTPEAEEEDGDEDFDEEEGNGEEEDAGDEITEDDVPEGMLRAAFSGNMKELQSCVHNKPEQMKDMYDRIGYPLHCAIFNDKPEAVEYLLRKGAKVNQKGALGQTPLHFACQSEVKKIFDAVVGTKGIEIDPVDDEGDTPLIVCAKYNRADYAAVLIQKGANLNKQNKEGDTALHICAQYGANDVAKLLIEKGANINLMNMQFKSAFILACESNSGDIAALLQGAFSNAQAEIVIEDYSDDDDK